jgi:peptidoglycan/LPS O-acetylase OafA/YrhL
VYLIHAPIVVAFGLLLPNFRTWWLAAVVVLCVTLALSYLSWTFVEEPALRRKKDVSKWLNSRFDAWCPGWSNAKRARVDRNQ